MRLTMLILVILSMVLVQGCSNDFDPTSNMVPVTPSEVRMEAENGATFKDDAHGYQLKQTWHADGSVSRDLKAASFNASLPF